MFLKSLVQIYGTIIERYEVMERLRYWIETEGSGHLFFLAFPICLLLLIILMKERLSKFAIPSLIITLIIINPWFYQRWINLGLYAYWRIIWIIPVIPVLAAVIPTITEKISRKNDQWIKKSIVVFGVGLVIFGGTFLYANDNAFVKSDNTSKLPEEVVAIVDQMLEFKNKPRIIADPSISIYIRQYTGEVDQLFGRDMYGFIVNPSKTARIADNAITTEDWPTVEQIMLDDEYDLLVTTKNAEIMELIDTIGAYHIYGAQGTPSVKKDRNELGQILSITFVDEYGNTIENKDGYSSVSYSYYRDGNISRESYLNENGILVNNRKTNYAYRTIEWDQKNEKTSEKYFDAQGNLTRSTAGYSMWDKQGDNIVYYDVDGSILPYDGINLVNGIEYGDDGWTEWITPTHNMENVCITIGKTLLCDKKEETDYSCQLEIEYKDVKVTEGAQFGFFSQGMTDNGWNVGNVWDWSLVWEKEVPKDGVYSYASTRKIDRKMAEAKIFDIGFRCDYWAGGSFRVRSVKIEKGDSCSAWTPGL